MAVASNPTISVVSAPKRAISKEPSTAVQANSTGGKPVRMPTCVSDIPKSVRISGMTGGTAKIVMRSPIPASQSSNTQMRNWRRVAAESTGACMAYTGPMNIWRNTPWLAAALNTPGSALVHGLRREAALHSAHTGCAKRLGSAIVRSEAKPAPPQKNQCRQIQPRAAAREDCDDCVPPEFCPPQRRQRGRRRCIACDRATAHSEVAARIELPEIDRGPVGRGTDGGEVRQRDERG